MRLPNRALTSIVAGAVFLSLCSTQAATTNVVPVADTSLFEQNPDNNLGGMNYLNAGTIRLGKFSRALLKFDVAAALPAGATVTSASLALIVPTARGAGHSFALHRALKDWGEGAGAGGGGATAVQGAPAAAGEATWNARFHPDTLWDAPGGNAGSDFVTNASATATMAIASLAFSSSDMAADVQAWLESPETNFGWLLKAVSESTTDTASHISSRESGASAPVLTIEYTISTPPPPPAPPAISGVALEGNQFRFSFTAESNHTYTVQYRDSFTATNWSELTNFAPQPSERVLQVTDPLSPSVPERYYQVEAQ